MGCSISGSVNNLEIPLPVALIYLFCSAESRAMRVLELSLGFCPFTLREVSVLTELTLGHLRYLLTDVPPQSNSPPDTVFRADHHRREAGGLIPESRSLRPALRLTE